MNRTKKISRHKCFHSFHLYKIFNCFELIIFHGAKKKLQNVVFAMAPFHYCSDARERETDEYFGCENSRMCLICFSLHFSLAVCIRVDFGAMKKHSLALTTPLSVDDTDFVSVAFQFFWKHWTLFTASLTWHNIYLAAAAAVATRDRKKVPFIKNKHSK